jgi:uncharacterized C2H2 Zn-finger protein
LTRRYTNDFKVKCPECGAMVRLRNNGALNKHGYVHSRNGLAIRGNPCPGSGKVFGGKKERMTT